MATFHVDPTTGLYATIQAAVDAAKLAAGDNDVIEIAAGTYKEQVVIDGQSGLKLVAFNGGEVKIVAPDDVTSTATSVSGRALNGVLTVKNSADVEITGIDVDGRGVGNTVDGSSANFVGIVYRNASGKLENVDVTGIHDAYPGGTTADGYPVQSGNQRGVGVQVDNDANLAFTMIGGSISDFQKNATVFNHAILDVSGVTIMGGGAQTINAQNGFQALNSTGSIHGNTITAFGYAGPSNTTSTAVLAYGDTNLDIKDNTITGSTVTSAEVVGIYILDFGTPNNGGEISGNAISYVDTGIAVTGDFTSQGPFIHSNAVTDLDPTNPDAVGIDFEPDANLAVPFDVEGTDGNDILIGSSGDDTLSGLGGDDLIDGRGGNDTIDGGLGADTLDMSGAGAAGSLVDLASGTAFSTATGIDSLANIENVKGSDGADSLNGDGNANVLTGGSGNDVLTGRGGADTIDGGTGFDRATFSGSASAYTFAAGAGNSVVLTGLDSQDSLTNVEMLSFASGPEVWIVSNSAELANALANVSQDGTIKLADGTYSGNFVIKQDGITLESLSGDETAVVLKGSFRTDNAVPTGTTVGDFLETATSYSGASGAGLSVQADNVSIRGITIREYRTGIDLRSNTGLTIDNVVFDENIHGIYKESGSAAVTDFSLINSHFEDGYQGVIINAGTNAASSGGFSGVFIDNVSFARLVEKGMYFEQLSDAELSNLDMNDVGQFGRATPFGPAGQNGAAIDINLKYLAYSDIHIHDFDFTNVGLSTGATGQSHLNGGAIHIKARDDGSYATNPATLDGVVIENGSIVGTSTGIRIGEPAKTTAGPTDVTITGVAITGATAGSYDNQTSTLRTVTLGSGADVVNVNPAATGGFSFDGGAGNDSIAGGKQDDEFKGGAGSDTIVGGLHGALGDTVVFEKSFASYTVTKVGGAYSVSDNATGNIDLVSEVENFKFSDRTFLKVDVDDTALLTPPPPPPPPAGNTAPTLVAANADETVQAGASLSLTIGDGHFTDPQDTDLNYAVTFEGASLPSWIAFDTETGAFTANPTTANVGQFTIVVTASDGSLTASDEFELIVTNPATPEDPNGTEGKDNLVGDGSDNILDGKEGNDKLTGGDGADTFVLGKHYGHDKVLDFDPLEGDKIDLSDAAGIKNFNDLMNHHIKDTDGGLKIIADDGSTLFLKGDIDADDLTADMFLF